MLEEKQNLAAQLRGRDANIAGEDTDTEPGEKPEQLNFVDSLKKAFDDLTSNQTASELLKIFALAIGAMALAKFALKFKDQLSDVLEFIKKTLIPEFKDLNDDIDSYQGLGGLSKLKLFAKIGTAFAAIPLAISKFIIDPFGKIAKKIKGARVGAMLQIRVV